MPDLKFALRRLGASPIFSIFAVVSLALGIGATTAIYSMVRVVLSPPPGVPNLERIVKLYPFDRGRGEFSLPDYEDFRARQKGFERVTAWRDFAVAIAANGQALTSYGEIVGGDYFHVLGVTPGRGRLLQPSDDLPGAAPVAVIAAALSRRLFPDGRDPLGQDIKLNGARFQIAGVAPPEFRGLAVNGLVPGSVWVPLSSVGALGNSLGSLGSRDRSGRGLYVRGLLPPASSVADVAAEVAGIGAQIESEHPTPGSRSRRQWRAMRITDNLLEDAGTFAHGLIAAIMIAVGAVLLIACSNLANLMLARGFERRTEIAVRLALGASRARLLRATMMDSVLITIAGGFGGLAVARWIVVTISGDFALVGTAGTIAFYPQLGAAAFMMAAAATLVTLVVVGLGPALQSTRANVRGALTDGGSSGILPWRGRRVLIAAQVAASVVLLSMAALAVGQLRETEAVDSGIDIGRLAVASVTFADQQYDNQRAMQIADAIVAGLSRHQDVAAAAVSTGLPLGEGLRAAFGQLRASATSPVRSADVVAGSSGLLSTLGVPLLAGRTWTTGETGPVIVLSRASALALFDTEQAVGRIVEFRQPRDGRLGDFGLLQVIGVAADTDERYAGHRESSRVAYMPITNALEWTVVFTARTSGDVGALDGIIRQTIASVDRDLAVRLSGPLVQFAGYNTQFYSIAGGVASWLGSFAWLLAVVGLYGVLTNIIVRRTREIGVRVALGATPGDIVRLVIRQGLRPVIGGVVFGLVFGALGRLALQPNFPRLIPAVDYTVVAIAPVVFFGAALLACYLPARRAARIDPNVALRTT